MATKNEKLVGLILGAGIGGFVAYNKQIDQDLQQKNTNNAWLTLKGILVGGISGYGLATIFGTPNDTVNYTHYYKGKRVYEGITYSDRLKKRMAEHRAKGKNFNRVLKDHPKPRVEAIKLERERIIKYRPVNNIQFNRQ